MFLQKTIFTGFSPNSTFHNVLTALKFLCLPWNWISLIKGGYPKRVEQWFRNYFNIKNSFTFDSGRTALHFALKSLDVKKGDEVLVQAYTCVVVSNAINWTGAKAVYVDINNDFNMDLGDLEKKITDKSKVLIIQHTFGLPAKLDQLLEIAKRHNLKIIEDCAHSLGTRCHGKLTGTFGNIGMFSFGSDKIVSCVRGGALITNDFKIAEKIKYFQNNLKPALIVKTIQHLMHYPLFFISKPLYSMMIGKIILGIAKRLSIMNKIIYLPEKRGKQVLFYPSLLSNSLAEIALNQLKNLDKVNTHRKNIAEIYNRKLKNKYIKLPWKDVNMDNNICLRYPVLTNYSKELIKYAKQRNIILGDWYNTVIAPADIDLYKIGYRDGACPNAELLSKQSVNLPTNHHISNKDAERIIKVINAFKHN